MTFPDRLQPEVTGFPPMDEVSRPTASVVLELEHRVNGSLFDEGREETEEALRWQAIRALRESGYFAEVGPVVPNPDLELIIGFELDEDINRFGIFATVLTAFVIPSRTRHAFVLDAIVRSPRTGEKWELRMEDSMRQWMQLFLVFGAPFARQPTVQNEVCENMFRRLAVELHQRQILTAGR